MQACALHKVKSLRRLGSCMLACSFPSRHPSLRPGSWSYSNALKDVSTVRLTATVWTHSASHPCHTALSASSSHAASAAATHRQETARSEGQKAPAVTAQDDGGFLAPSETTFSSLQLNQTVADALAAAGFARPAQVQVSMCTKHACPTLLRYRHKLMFMCLHMSCASWSLSCNIPCTV